MSEEEAEMADDAENTQDLDTYTPQPVAARFLQVAGGNGVVRITLNRPPANVMSIDLMDELNATLESLDNQRDLKFVVLAAAGKYFSAGFELGDHLGDRAYLMMEAFKKIFENMTKLDRPVLAVVAGPALGAGSILAAACDMVLAGASAKFGHPEIKGGVFNPMAAALLPRLVGRKRAFEMILGGVTITAAEAERIGLISRAVPDEKLEAEAAAVVQRYEEGSAPILQLTRRAIATGLDQPLADAIRNAEDIYLNQLMSTEDAEEGLKAIVEKRKPVWKDR
ncbi:MAG TPA: enoyl-CoA hydratase/isomerase family protein [Vicinamibacteria bacterium]|nr:enoyl-CoA hydratase/isomerase family protein [Vicinamibacteria bacterium]